MHDFLEFQNKPQYEFPFHGSKFLALNFFNLDDQNMGDSCHL